MSENGKSHSNRLTFFIVLAIVAMTPIVLMPLAAITEGDHPSKLAIVGAVVAVCGAILLNVWA